MYQLYCKHNFSFLQLFLNLQEVNKHQVKEKLRESGIKQKYWVAVLKLDPKRLSQPVTRRRVYINLVRKNPG